MTPNTRGRAAVSWFFLLAAALSGCFAQPDLSQISCTTDKQCAPGYACDLSRSLCQRRGDAGPTADVLPSVEVAAHPDTTQDAARIDAAGAFDQRPSDTQPDASLLVEAGAADGPAEDGGTKPDLSIGDSSVAPVDAPGDLPPIGHPDLAVDRISEPDAAPVVDAAPDSPQSVDSSTGAPLATACVQPSDCASGHCIDGVCCESECDGVCRSCALEGSRGACRYVTGAPSLARGACPGSGACAGTCSGTSGSCSFPGAQVVCGSASCSSGAALSAGTCDGAGSCSSGTVSLCGTYACSGGACLSRCTGNSQCAAGAACVGSSCTKCASGESVCDGACLNVQTSNLHCGSCTAAACGTGEQCTGGKCLLQDGRPCTAASQCASGVCPLFYPDADGDGYPIQINPKGHCNVDSPPSPNYLDPRFDGKWDCFDSDDTVNPGIYAFFAEPNANYGWDWNCSGAMEKSPTTLFVCVGDESTGTCDLAKPTGTPPEPCGAVHVGFGTCLPTSTEPLVCSPGYGAASGTVLCH